MHRIGVRAGDWAPGTHNLALMIIQLIVLAQASLRGFDYIQPGQVSLSLGAVERALPLPYWGWAFIITAGVALLGFAGRWASPIMAAHAVLASLYVGLGVGILVDNSESLGWLTALGILIGGGGTWLVLHHGIPTPWRVLVGAPCMLAAQYLLSIDLGSGYRTGTGLVGAGLLHGTLAAGTLVLWTRQRARAQVAEERSSPLVTG